MRVLFHRILEIKGKKFTAIHRVESGFSGFSRWPTRKFRNFMKILKYSIIGPKTSVTPLYMCFWGQETHFWCYFLNLTKNTQNGGQKSSLWSQNVKYFKIWLKILRKIIHNN